MIDERFNTLKPNKILPGTPRGIIKTGDSKKKNTNVGIEETYSLLPPKSPTSIINYLHMTSPSKENIEKRNSVNKKESIEEPLRINFNLGLNEY